MTHMPTLDQLGDALCRSLALPKGALGPDDAFRARGEIDSLTLELITLEIEEMTGLTLDLAALVECRTLRELHALIATGQGVHV